MSFILLCSITILLFIIEFLYFKIADHYGIIDQPNHRSSHTLITIRGGGIIFVMAMLMYPVFFGLAYLYFLIGIFIISAISFLDDLSPVSNKLRILCHFVAVGLLFYQLEGFNFPVYIIVIGFILSIGIINAINFMDGINGITGSYTLVTLASLLYINEAIVEFTSSDLVIMAILAVVVFNFFNFRTKAKCFAGDVGSVSIAFILIFLIGQLITATRNPLYLLLLLVYGLDAISTILFRLIRKENIFQAHRSHYYQYLANERKIPQLFVAAGYALVQLLFNVLLLFLLPIYSTVGIGPIAAFLFIITAIFIMIRFSTEGKDRLIKPTTS